MYKHTVYNKHNDKNLCEVIQSCNAINAKACNFAYRFKNQRIHPLKKIKKSDVFSFELEARDWYKEYTKTSRWIEHASIKALRVL